MVEKFSEILKEIKRNRGSVYVFAILKVDELIDKWSVILAAPWIDQANTAEVFGYILALLKMKLNDEESSLIARIGIFNKDEHIVKLINDSINVEDGVVTLKNTKLNGYTIHEAYIFESVKDPGQINSKLPLK